MSDIRATEEQIKGYKKAMSDIEKHNPNILVSKRENCAYSLCAKSLKQHEERLKVLHDELNNMMDAEASRVPEIDEAIEIINAHTVRVMKAFKKGLITKAEAIDSLSLQALRIKLVDESISYSLAKHVSKFNIATQVTKLQLIDAEEFEKTIQTCDKKLVLYYL